MTTRHRIVVNLYKDSVALMAISSRLLALDGVTAASVVMATPANLDNLAGAGLAGAPVTRPSDLLVAVAGSEAGCEAALALADALLAEVPSQDSAGVAEAPTTSLQMAVARDAALNFALISVPGAYAAAEAMKALRLGLHVMVFSDNVPPDQELALKRYASDHGLMVMGPDCGTAIVNGLPLGFANVVRRGGIGVVGASGTGMQEVTSRIHNLGGGVSQALGTGGHDLSEAIGGLSMLTGLRALEQDPETRVIVLISKPPAPAVAKKVLDAARALTTPVVVVFLGADPSSFSDERIHGAATLAEAADIAVALVSDASFGSSSRPRSGSSSSTSPQAVDAATRAALDSAALGMAPGQRYIRGILCGGTFCYEAQLILQARGLGAWSNTPVAGNALLPDLRQSREHTLLDMGDDAFTQGRPHPMIDPTLRDERIAREAADPGTAVLLLDVVLGYGSAADPVAGLLAALACARGSASHAGRTLAVIAHVCGTDADPQHRGDCIAGLRAAGALVAQSNAEAARWAAELVTHPALTEGAGHA